jgi:hypothetical protein
MSTVSFPTVGDRGDFVDLTWFRKRHKYGLGHLIDNDESSMFSIVNNILIDQLLIVGFGYQPIIDNPTPLSINY